VNARNRKLRYGLPIATIIVGVLFAAVDTGSLGNTVVTVLSAGGLIWFMVVVGRDLGMGEMTGRRRHVPAPPPERVGLDGRENGHRNGRAPAPPARHRTER